MVFNSDNLHFIVIILLSTCDYVNDVLTEGKCDAHDGGKPSKEDVHITS